VKLEFAAASLISIEQVEAVTLIDSSLESHSMSQCVKGGCRLREWNGPFLQASLSEGPSQ